MIRDIQIENYRGIENLKVDKFGKYNFFVGDNGSCKTTLLEAILCSLPSWTSGIIATANSRGMLVKNNNIDNFFHNSNSEKEMKFTLNNEIITKIKVNKKNDLLKENFLSLKTQEFNGDKISVNGEIYEFLYNISKETLDKKILDVDIMMNKSFRLHERLNMFDDEINLYTKNYKSNNSFWISPITKFQIGTADVVQKIIENKQKDKMLEILNIFEKDIDDIAVNEEQILLSKKNINKMLSLSSFGNGLAAILDICSCLILNDIKYLFIDEIETGIHYLNYPNLCKTLIEISSKKDMQVFITTHSREFLEVFYKEIEKSKDSVSLHRFQKKNNELKKVYYDRKRAIDALKNGWDVR